MSHVVDMELDIKDLELLEKACPKLGLEFVRDQTKYKWYGRSVGDTPLPEGFTEEDLGHCKHAIRVKGAGPNTYEIGVMKRKDGRPGYQLIWDFWKGGFGLQDKIGENGGLLKQHYTSLATKKQLLREGYRVTETVNKAGEMLLEFVA